jgi:sugar fermentation stimulation protein A
MVETSDGVQTCHVKNTGRCAELLVSGARVYLAEASPTAVRKTRFDLVAVEKGDLLINMDSQAPNQAAREFLQGGGLQHLFGTPTLVRAETTWGDSRFDFYLESAQTRAFVEVKGVTLEQNGVALFPDAPTQRGIKHLEGLARAVEQGFGAGALFVIQMQGVHTFRPNEQTHPAFADALRRAQAAGVHIAAYDCIVTPNSMTLHQPVQVEL